MYKTAVYTPFPFELVYAKMNLRQHKALHCIHCIFGKFSAVWDDNEFT